MQILLESMSDELVTSIEDKRFAYQVFDHLSGVYEGRNTGSLVMARREFTHLTYEDGQDMQQHLNRLTTLANAWAPSGRDNEEKALQLLDSLPASWDAFKSVYYVQTPALAYEALEQACTSEQRRRVHSTAKVPEPTASVPPVTEANFVHERLM